MGLALDIGGEGVEGVIGLSSAPMRSLNSMDKDRCRTSTHMISLLARRTSLPLVPTRI